jgi:short-subunit dehydrogenase
MHQPVKRAIIIGASSGIGRKLAVALAEEGYELGLAGRRTELLEELAGSLPTRGYVKTLDLNLPAESRQRMTELLDEMGDVELIIVNSGIGHHDPDWHQELEVIAVNVTGFAAMANLAMDFFLRRGSGHLVGISSIAALRGLRSAYSGSKAFVSTYLEGLRLKADGMRVDVHVTDVKPGFVDTPMTEGRKDMFWVASAELAARQIATAIKKKKRHVYVTRRWRLMAWLMKSLPYPVVSFLVARRQGTAR